MNEKNKILPPNRVDESMEQWIIRERAYIEKYGPELLKDRDYMKAKQDAWRSIYADHRSQKLNPSEKIDHRILKGQIKQLDRQIYKIPLIRLLRNTVLLVANLIKLVANLVKLVAIAAAKPILMSKVSTNKEQNNVLTQHIPAKNENSKGQDNQLSQSNSQPVSSKNLPEQTNPKNGIYVQQPDNTVAEKRRNFGKQRLVAENGQANGLKM